MFGSLLSWPGPRSKVSRLGRLGCLPGEAKYSVKAILPETYVDEAGNEGNEGLYFNRKSTLAGHLFGEDGISALGTWREWYQAPWWLQQGDLMTILAGSLREISSLAVKKLWVETLAGEMPIDLFEGPKTSRVVILIPGLGGSTEGGYVKNMAASLIREGFTVIGLNLGLALQKARSSSAHRGATDDLRVVAQYVRKNFLNTDGSSKVFAIGWSLGGNILVNALAEQKTKEGKAHSDLSFLDGGISLCTTHCLERCALQWEKHWPMQNVYDPHVLRNLKSLLEPAIPFYSQGMVRSWIGTAVKVDHEMLRSATRIRDVDEALIRRMFGYETVDDYYYEASSCRRLADVEVPLLMVSAADDPMTTSWAPFQTVRANENVILAYTKHGGHIAWQDESNARKSEWVEEVSTGFFKRLLTFEGQWAFGWAIRCKNGRITSSNLQGEIVLVDTAQLSGLVDPLILEQARLLRAFDERSQLLRHALTNVFWVSLWFMIYDVWTCWVVFACSLMMFDGDCFVGVPVLFWGDAVDGRRGLRESAEELLRRLSMHGVFMDSNGFWNVLHQVHTSQILSHFQVPWKRGSWTARSPYGGADVPLVLHFVRRFKTQ